MALFNEQEFYPTPPEVVERMISGATVSNKIILEPSAGSGNIVDILLKYGATEVIACEHNDKLRSLLSMKCDILCSDFFDLKSEDVSHIDMIVMNPPFSNADKHILHAYNIAPGGCEIIALCNETLVEDRRWSSSTGSSVLKEILETEGSYESFGDCFNNSDVERRANVSVACLRIFKPKTDQEEFADYFSTEEEVEEQQNGIMPYDFVRDVVNRYVGSIKLFDGVMEASNNINQMASLFSNYGITFGAHTTNSSNGDVTSITKAKYKKYLQKRAWDYIFDKMNMGKFVTRGVKEDINRFVEKQENVPFTMGNIYLMIEMVIKTHGGRMGKVLIETFDNICSYSAENNTAGEKWKTNSDYKVNKRFIIPYMTKHDNRWPSHYVQLSYSTRADLTDIEKSFCYLTGQSIDNIRTIENLIRDNKIQWGEKYETTFFYVRSYKKGTMHFEFKDKKIWDLFNLRVAEAKGWQLPKAKL